MISNDTVKKDYLERKNNWKEFLEEKGFKYDANNEYYKISLGFGRNIVVDQMVKGLFRVTKCDQVFYDNFIKSFDEFQKIIEKVLV